MKCKIGGINMTNWPYHAVALLLVTLTTSLACAQSGDYLNAPIVEANGTILLAVDSNPSSPGIHFNRVDHCPDVNKVELGDSWTVLNKGKVNIAVCNYNPLRWKFGETQKEGDSTAWTNLQTIFSAASAFGQAVATPNKSQQFSASACNLACTIQKTDEWLNDLPANVEKWATQIDDGYKASSGYDVMKNAQAVVDSKAVEAQSNRENLEKAINDSRSPHGLTLEDEHLLRRAEAQVTALSRISFSLSSLSKSIGKIEAGPWAQNDIRAYVIGTPIATSAWKSKTVTLTGTQLELKATKTANSDTTEIGISTGDSGTLTVLVEKYWALYPSPGAGPVFTTFEKPVYVPADSGSQKAVSLKKMQRLDAQLSGSLNWVFHKKWHGIAPYAQTGFTNVNDVNGLLLGGGLRLFGFGKTDIGVSGGALVGWYKDLHKLRLGDVVADQDAIDNDLTRHVKTAPFACLQVKF